ncbi:MAG TPA: maltose alpha-D-glucosyltransferase [Acidimicrobiales bacterium]|jgi:maltose alpha-D-glucosyltransferase/alpha-amylase
MEDRDEADEVTGLLAGDPEWFRRAVFYELLVRGYQDSDGDGNGDLRGVIGKLDHLEWLGIDCLWLLPFYDSPLHDGGYDVADFCSVHPDYGTIDDARELVVEAHRRGIRVIADLVINHTSNAHQWFQDSRTRRNGKDDWYVWSDDNQRYPGVANVFPDTESGCWTFDDVRGQFYWHRFFHHQPDLNYDNPDVRAAICDVVCFWLDIGFDGFRLDAVPYLFERDGTSCEGLPETHAFLKELRGLVDDKYPGRVLLAEANGLPADVVDYYGDGDECHMCFHFPLMPRMFMAVRREQRYPITETLDETPPLPPGCQWGLFLRNHDELALAQVTDDERDYLVREYAKDPRAKLHLGIRRRLFPLIDNDRRVAELFHALLFSMPGSPVLYYGDEIGMGDNIFLGDRDTVRTPMQWTPDRNGGFSRADYQQIYLPPLMDPIYGFAAVNVEAQQRDSSSFLHWLRSLLAARRRHPVFGTGEFEVLPAANPSILAYLRTDEPAAIDGDPGDDRSPFPIADRVLCVNNLSRFAQPVELMLGRFAGLVPFEVIGRAPFPRITHQPYQLTLAPYGFFWFRLANLDEEL